MSAVVWAPKLAALDVALASTIGTVHGLGVPIRDSLSTKGAAYDVRFAAQPGVNAAKVAWLAAAAITFAEADRVARYALSTVAGLGIPPPALDFDPFSVVAIKERIMKARKDAPAFEALLAAELGAVEGAYSATGGFEDYMKPWTKAENAGMKVDYSTHPATYTPQFKYTVLGAQPVRALELELVAILAKADAWLALANFS
jgi:hypothetical protein